MAATKYSPFLAFSFLLVLLISGSLVIQTLGHVLDINLAPVCLFIMLPPALYLTYGYCFASDRRHIITALALAALLAGIGHLSRHWYDFSADGLAYQQPAVEAIMQGWNPLRSDSDMLWQNIYPNAVAEAEASLAFLYGSVECAKMLHVWWLFIVLPVLLAGLSNRLGDLNRTQTILAVLSVLSATTLNQLLTHYVDALAYLAGLTFIGALLLYGGSKKANTVAGLIMASCILFLVNVKLTGLYHAIALSAGAVLFLRIRSGRIPWRLSLVLLVTGMIAVFVIGFRPYVTNAISYDHLLHYFPASDQPSDVFIGTQRPSSYDGLWGFERFFYSVFSVTGGAPHQPAFLKLPWTIQAEEWKFSGDPDARTGGFGPFYALGLIGTFTLLVYVIIRKLPYDRGLAALAALCLLSSALFSQSWWARYVPFAYCAPFLFLLCFPPTTNAVVRRGIYALIAVFAANSAMVASSALALFTSDQAHFREVAALLRKQPAGSVYLMTPVVQYRKYNDSYMPITRRLKEQGVEASLKIAVPCPHVAGVYSGYLLCY